MPRVSMLNRPLRSLLLSLLIFSSTVSFPSATQAQSSQTPELFQAELETVYLINLARRQAGLAPLRWNRELSTAARWFAHDVVETLGGGYCAHVDSLGRAPGQRMRAFGYIHLGRWAENVLCGYVPPSSAVRAWMQSPSHRENVINANFREVGLGYYRNQAGGGYIVLDLSADADYAPVIINDEAPNTASPQVKLYLYDQANGTDWLDVGPTVEMMIANNPDFSGARWQPYAVETEWALDPGDGWRTVYVKTRDRQGRTTIVSDTIYLGASAPADELTLEHASAVADGFQINQIQADQYPQIAMSLNWLADDTDAGFELLYGAGQRIDDPAAEGGTAFRMIGSTSPTYVKLGASRFFRDMPAIAYLRLKISDNASDREMLQVVLNDGLADIAGLALQGNDFAAPDVYQEFALPFILPADGGGLLTFQIQRTGSADIVWDTASLYTAPVPTESTLIFHAPGDYYRSSGAQARLISPSGAVSDPIELYPHLSRMDGTLTFIAPFTPTVPTTPTVMASPTALAFSVPDSGALPVTATVALVCQACGTPTWLATTDAAWLAATVETGNLTVRADPTNLAIGIYYGFVSVVVDGAPELAPLQLEVMLMVGEPGQVFAQTLFLPIAAKQAR